MTKEDVNLTVISTTGKAVTTIMENPTRKNVSGTFSKFDCV